MTRVSRSGTALEMLEPDGESQVVVSSPFSFGISTECLHRLVAPDDVTCITNLYNASPCLVAKRRRVFIRNPWLSCSSPQWRLFCLISIVTDSIWSTSLPSFLLPTATQRNQLRLQLKGVRAGLKDALPYWRWELAPAEQKRL